MCLVKIENEIIKLKNIFTSHKSVEFTTCKIPLKKSTTVTFIGKTCLFISSGPPILVLFFIYIYIYIYIYIICQKRFQKKKSWFYICHSGAETNKCHASQLKNIMHHIRPWILLNLLGLKGLILFHFLSFTMFMH